MGQETIYFKDKYFYYSSTIISWVQKFMELFLSELEQPKWFKDVLQELHGDFYIPYRKEFFDKEIIGEDNERLNYCLKMLELTISKMESISKKDFFEFIKEDIKDSWCDISDEFYDEEWLNDSENYKEKYIGLLFKLKEIMEEN